MSFPTRRARHVPRHRAPARRPGASASAAFALGVTVAATATLGAAPAHADPPVQLTGITAYQPSLSPWYSPQQVDHCLAGNFDCAPVTIAKMDAQLASYASSCDHRAPFALAYLRTTEEYQRAVTTPGFFQDPAFLNVWDVFFASYYFKASDDWSAGNTAAVPRAWQIAFTAADNKSVSGLGDILLGMNAHINRDLPYVLAGLGLVAPDGTSRHADHLKVNEFLDRVAESMLEEAAVRFDPTIDDLDSPYGITYTAFMQIIAVWRESAWLNARLLATASSPAARALVGRTIEQTSATIGLTLRTGSLYLPSMTTARDDYCAAHHG
ncbi:hypothetical protein I6A84_18735 [Frankia sp. CNm7]|uniref:Secreted protein n=1 Tax=Frankia nepalensis TaxID=1836974 RepID=A0A937RB44_9ACTN|nr:DUF5995 family protein [Frankia nepalensis]MBL7498367.1 hypothetical protein [Frankia nepalensis]MBL7513224.1 hypothetical protein [Frankia nepalensis]MBL7520072.1 hypothetical protein [Frankia nepalensis]MBL7628908.1 hypothetical protein [Frankia nepalensis]